MHLPERHAHLLEYIFLFDAGADQIGLNLFDELLELIPRDVVIDQRAVLDVVRRALIVVVVAELVTGADDLHAEILVGADHVTRAQSADEQHDLLARETRLVFSITACMSGLYFAMTRSAPSLMRSSKWLAMRRSDSSILLGPKKLYSTQGIPYFSSMWREM